jgi:hypothetical protein
MLILETLPPVFPIILLFLWVGHAPVHHRRDVPSIFFQTHICTGSSTTKSGTPTRGVSYNFKQYT